MNILRGQRPTPIIMAMLALIAWTAICVAALLGTVTAFARPLANPPTITSITPSSAVAGAGFTLTVNGNDFDAGTSVAVNGISLTVSAVDTNTITGTAALGTFTSAGSYSVTIANAEATVTATQPFTILPAPATAIIITPTSATLTANTTQAFTAGVYDSYGNLRASDAPTWTGGTFSASPGIATTYTAPTTAGTYAITATFGTLTKTANINVVAGSAYTIDVTPIGLTVLTPPSPSRAFTAVVKDQYGNPTGGAVAWTSSAGTFAPSAVVSNPTWSAPSNAAPTTYVVTAATNGVAPVTRTITVNTGPAASLVITPTSATLTAGGTQAFTSGVNDGYGNLRAGDAPIWQASSGTFSSGGSASNNPTYTAPPTAGTYAITATTGTFTKSGLITVTAGTATQLTIVPANPATTAGSPIAFTAYVSDTNGNAIPGGSVNWSVTNGVGSVTSTGARTATYSSTTTGSATVTATLGSANGSANVTVNAGAANNVLITAPANNLNLFAPVSAQSFSAIVRDVYGNNTGLPPNWTATGGSIGASGNSVSYTPSNTPNTYIVTASYPGATSAQRSITVNVGTPTALSIGPLNQSVSAGTSMPFTASVTDGGGNVVSTGTVAWQPSGVITGTGTGRAATFATGIAGTYLVTATFSDGVTTLTKTTTVSVGQGTATTLNILANTTTAQAGNTVYLTATVLNENGVPMNTSNVTWGVTTGGNTVITTTSSRTASFSSTLSETKVIRARFNGASPQNTITLTITPGNANNVIITVPGSSLSLFAPVSAQTFIAIVRDAYNNDTGLLPNWSAGSGIISGTGNTVSYTPPNTPATYFVVATYPGATSWTRSVVVNVGPATALSITPLSASVVAGTSVPFGATVTDGANNVVSTGTVTWSPGGVITGTGTGRTATFATVVSGTYTVDASFTEGPNTFNQTATVTVVPGAPYTITLAPPNATMTVSTARQFVATVSDVYGNKVPGQTLTWTVSSPFVGTVRALAADTAVLTGSIKAGVYPAGLRVTNGTITRTATITLIADQLAQVLLDPTGDTLTPNETQLFTAVAADQFQNPVTGYTFTWSVSSPSVGSVGPLVASATTFQAGTNAGYYPLAVRAVVISGTKRFTGTADITISPSAVASIIVSPASATLPANTTQSFTAQAFDTFGNLIPHATFDWDTLGTGLVISTSGSSAIVQAGTVAGVFTDAVRARVNTVVGTASLTIVPGPLDHIDLAPGIVALTVNSPQPMRATGYDAWNNVRDDLDVVWSVDAPTAGAFDSTSAQTAVFRAGTTPGTYPNTIRARSGSVIALASVVVIQGTVAKVNVSPASVTIGIHQTRLFTATVTDPFGNPFPQLSVLWQLSPANIGTIVSSGPLTALVRMNTQAGIFINGLQAFNGSIGGNAAIVVPTDSPSVVNVDANPTTLTTDGSSSSTIIVTVTDQYGNAVGAGQDVSLAVDQCGDGGTCSLGTSTASTDPQGRIVTTLRSNHRSPAGTTSTIRVTARLGNGTSKSVTILGTFKPFLAMLPMLTRDFGNNHEVCTAMSLSLPDVISQTPSTGFNLYRLTATSSALNTALSDYAATGKLLLYRITEDNCASGSGMKVQFLKETGITSSALFQKTFDVTPGESYLLAVYTIAGFSDQPYVLNVAP